MSDIYNPKRFFDRHVKNRVRLRQDGLDKQRVDFAVIRAYLDYDGRVGDAKAAIKAAVKDRTPEGWLRAALSAEIPCHRCGCTGQYVTGSVNGKLTGPGGECFRCGGKGFQSWKDGKRNYYFDLRMGS